MCSAKRRRFETDPPSSFRTAGLKPTDLRRTIRAARSVVAKTALTNEKQLALVAQ
jgi:hypothetical protein